MENSLLFVDLFVDLCKWNSERVHTKQATFENEPFLAILAHRPH